LLVWFKSSAVSETDKPGFGWVARVRFRSSTHPSLAKVAGFVQPWQAKNEAKRAIIISQPKNSKKYIAPAGTTVTIRDPLSIGGGRDVR
jgi:hypothetical protein